MNIKNIFISILLAGFAGVLIVFFYFYSQINSEYKGPETLFTVNIGEGFSSVNYRLSKEKLISDARAFHYYTKFKGDMSNIKAGTYRIANGTSMAEVLAALTSGIGELTKVTIPEGKNLFEIGKILEANKVTTYVDFVAACRNPEVIKSIGVDAPSVEGYLFPETYNFAPNTPARQVVATFLRQFQAATKNVDLTTASNLSPHEVVILASIVEKETGAKWERPTIAGVYLNRLKINMRLQADPTTIYGIWENYDGNLKRSHLLQKTEYNTYKMSGLPLGPIANPSLAAIKAVLAPKEHNFLYFVSKNDGTHVFTPTYKEHQKAVDYWQRNYKRRKGKSWRDLKQ